MQTWALAPAFMTPGIHDNAHKNRESQPQEDDHDRLLIPYRMKIFGDLIQFHACLTYTRGPGGETAVWGYLEENIANGRRLAPRCRARTETAEVTSAGPRSSLCLDSATAPPARCATPDHLMEGQRGVRFVDYLRRFGTGLALFDRFWRFSSLGGLLLLALPSRFRGLGAWNAFTRLVGFGRFVQDVRVFLVQFVRQTPGCLPFENPGPSAAAPVD